MRDKVNWTINSQESLVVSCGIFPDDLDEKKKLIDYMVESRKKIWPYNQYNLELNKLKIELEKLANVEEV